MTQVEKQSHSFKNHKKLGHECHFPGFLIGCNYKKTVETVIYHKLALKSAIYHWLPLVRATFAGKERERKKKENKPFEMNWSSLSSGVGFCSASDRKWSNPLRLAKKWPKGDKMGKKNKKAGKGKEKTERKTAKAEEKRARRETKKISPEDDIDAILVTSKSI